MTRLKRWFSLGFDPIRREIAKLTLEQLIADGRIHIRGELRNFTRKRLRKSMRLSSKRVSKLLLNRMSHDLHPELIRLLGRLKYRTSYGQNVLLHSKECASIAGIMATELGADPVIARRAALLHDIGKSIDWEMDGGHAFIGAEYVKRYGEVRSGDSCRGCPS